ncbi:MAG: hypothetical protein QOJ07_1324, partial [Thermoleophilaceae bacterium]|nr:hypothetical protein [Thermoleophilaceae bacterium]
MAALALVLTLPAAASAATAGESGGELSFQAAPGEANQTTVTIDPATKELFFFEGSVDITPGP